jgi:hypothetical protein
VRWQIAGSSRIEADDRVEESDADGRVVHPGIRKPWPREIDNADLVPFSDGPDRPTPGANEVESALFREGRKMPSDQGVLLVD